MSLFPKECKFVIQAFIPPPSDGSCLAFNNVWWGESMFALIFTKEKATFQNVGNES